MNRNIAGILAVLVPLIIAAAVVTVIAAETNFLPWPVIAVPGIVFLAGLLYLLLAERRRVKGQRDHPPSGNS